MSERNTVVRSMHDLGLAAWFGGSLMGAVGLNGATAEADDAAERLRLSSLGWGRWAPVNVAAIAANVVGGAGLLLGNRERLQTQQEGRTNTIVKTVLTGAAIALTGYSGALGRRVAEHSDNPTEGTTEPSSRAPEELSSAQKQLKYCQWAIPAITGVLIVMGAQQGEQQRPAQRLFGRH